MVAEAQQEHGKTDADVCKEMGLMVHYQLQLYAHGLLRIRQGILRVQ